MDVQRELCGKELPLKVSLSAFVCVCVLCKSVDHKYASECLFIFTPYPDSHLYIEVISFSI